MPNTNGVCVCNTSISIPKPTKGGCFICIGLQYSTGVVSLTNSSACSCIGNFIFNWDGTNESGSCVCPPLKKVNTAGNYCECDPAQTTCVTIFVGCDSSKGFILKNGVCVNCKDIPHTTGIAKDNMTCFCSSPFNWFYYYQVCQCYINSTGMLYFNNNECTGICVSITDTTLSSDCSSSNGSVFAYSIQGRVNCTSIPNGVAAVNGLCTCQTGYTFSSSLGSCLCRVSGYFLNGTTCQTCSSAPVVSSCNSCLTPTFINNGYGCRLATTIINIVAITGICASNYVLNKNPITNETISCVCSLSAGYYTNGSSCRSCEN